MAHSEPMINQLILNNYHNIYAKFLTFPLTEGEIVSGC